MHSCVQCAAVLRTHRVGMLEMSARSSFHVGHLLRWGRRPQPRMVQSLLRSEAVSGSTLEQTQHKIRSALGHFPPLLVRKTDVPLHNLSIQLVQHGVKKRQSARQQHVGHHSNSPQIHLSPIFFLFDDLRSQVKITPADGLTSGQSSWIVLALLGQSKIRDLDFSVAVDTGKKNVLRLQITVHNPFAVDVSYSLQQIDHQNLRLVLLIVALLLHSVVQFTAFTQLQNQSYSCGTRVIIVHQMHNGGMSTQSFQDVDLFENPSDPSVVPRIGLNNFESKLRLGLAPLPTFEDL
mmetsp:Transcript_34654/g.83710  ORF Transcript_34654/g.83710 Transcript_34654/m.83710 type:complete len:292 (-) Transcript_34654:126-1001(-)